MKIAYIILAHNNIEQLKRLVNRLDEESSIFVIHFDKNSSEREFDLLKSYFSEYQNVFFSKRIRCYWGDYSLVRATLESIKILFNKKLNFDYCFLLSGQDYPLVTNKEIKYFLKKNQGSQYIQYFEPIDIWKNNDRIEYFHFNKFNYLRKKSLTNYIITKCQLILKGLNIKRYSFPFDHFYGGGQWWCLSRDCLNYILDFTKNNKKEVSFFKFVLIPDELFFQTILLNSKFKNQIINNHLRYIDWSSNPAPKILGEEDFQGIINSNKLFARKFNTNRDKDILDNIDEAIFHNSCKEYFVKE